MKRVHFLPCAAVMLNFLANTLYADTPTLTPPAVPHVTTLAEALAAMPDTSVTDGSIVLTVEPNRVLPVPSPAADSPATPEETVQTPYTIAAHYGRSLQVFSHVIALASPTMTVLNTDPTLANVPLDVLAAQNPVPFLLGTLTQAQMQQMSTNGLALSDLSPDQQGLLKAALPSPLHVVPKALNMPSVTQEEMNATGNEKAEIDERIDAESKVYKDNTNTISEDRMSSSLRLYGFLTPDFVFDTPDGNGVGARYSNNGVETTGSFKLANGGRTFQTSSITDQLQTMLRNDLPNAPKASDLEWNQRALERQVSLQGLSTVNDLVLRIAKATGRELYADTRYGRQTFLARGDLKRPQPSGDVMQALALCVCGTWRQVGPAFVLTDDVQGLGARHKFLHEMVQIWSNRLTEADKAVGGHLSDLDWLHTLHFSPGDIGTLTTAQIDAIHKENGTNVGRLHWKGLSAPLQSGLRGQLTHKYNSEAMASFEALGNSAARTLTPDSSVAVTLNIRIGVGLPDTGVMTLGEPYRVQFSPQAPPSAAVTAPPKGQANSIVLDKPLRGILCAPKTPEEARAVVALLPKMGLNTLFLDVFTNGRTYFQNPVLQPTTAKAGDVLQAALDAAQTYHIPVYAVVDLLCWRKDGAAVHPQPWPEHFAEDLTITGETPDHSVQRQIASHAVRNDFDREYEMAEKGSQSWASPLDPQVYLRLLDLVHELAGIKGLSGLVFQNTAPPGYLGLDLTREYDDEGISLGYTPANRLAFLRAHFTDPIDLSFLGDRLTMMVQTQTYQNSFDISIPGFPSGETGPSQDWTNVRGQADKSLMASCFFAALNAAPALPLFMRERQIGAVFDPWTDPKTLNQYASIDSMDHPFHQITPASIISLPYGPVERAHPDRFVWMTQDYGEVGGEGKRAGGEVFDLVAGGAPENLLDTLDKLNVFLKKP